MLTEAVEEAFILNLSNETYLLNTLNSLSYKLFPALHIFGQRRYARLFNTDKFSTIHINKTTDKYLTIIDKLTTWTK